MPYDISGKAASPSVSTRSGVDSSSAKGGSGKRAAGGEARSNATKIAAAVAMLVAGIYLIVAGNIGLFPFGGSSVQPAPVSETEKKLMQSAPTKASEIQNLKEFEAMPENMRPIKAGS